MQQTAQDGLEQIVAEAVGWRHELHRHPELLYDVPWTAAWVAARLRSFGCDEVIEGIGRSGVVAVLHGSAGPGPVRAFRAELDALALTEDSGLEYSSQIPGRMHACGHDGHMAMLLGALCALARSRAFAGTIIGIFQPAEEGGAGARTMIGDGLLSRFGISRIYGMHNMPGMDPGRFAVEPGPMMAGANRFTLTFTGRGTHAAAPHLGADPILAAGMTIVALQSVVSRNADPRDGLVVSVTMVEAGTAPNIIPDTATLTGTVRALTPDVLEMGNRRVAEIAAGIAQSLGVTVSAYVRPGYPATINDPSVAGEVRRMLTDAGHVPDTRMAPVMASEDFSFFLEKIPGCFVFIGNGDSAPLHATDYRFNDKIMATGIRFWLDLAAL